MESPKLGLAELPVPAWLSRALPHVRARIPKDTRLTALTSPSLPQGTLGTGTATCHLKVASARAAGRLRWSRQRRGNGKKEVSV